MGRKKNSFKNRVGVVYSTNESYEYDQGEDLEEDTPANNQQKLRVSLDKKNRGGKKVTLVSGFVGLTKDIEVLGKMLKSKCGVGGNVKDREILIQGDHRLKVGQLLEKEGYNVKVL